MAQTPYASMAIEHLGNDATAVDLAEFQAAAAAYVCHGCGIDAQMATDYLWGSGDYQRRLYGEHCQLCHRTIANAHHHGRDVHGR